MFTELLHANASLRIADRRGIEPLNISVINPIMTSKEMSFHVQRKPLRISRQGVTDIIIIIGSYGFYCGNCGTRALSHNSARPVIIPIQKK